MPNALTDLTVAARFAARALGRRLRGEIDPDPDVEAFESAMEAALAALPAGVVRAHHWLSLPASEPPWRDTGVDVGPGSEASYFAVGRVYASRFLDIWVAPKNQIWARVGAEGELISSSRDSNTLGTSGAGRLFLGNYFPNDWKDRQGARLQDDAVYATVAGETRILIVEWAGSAREGLATLARAGDPMGLVSGEIEREAGAGRPPEGWRYLWHLGDAEIFSPDTTSEGAPMIRCDVAGDVGILQKDVDFPLEPETEISWGWKVEALPGLLREDTVPSHDYLSIAVEFDDGWDLTYYWSAALPPATGYVCPLPNWKHREYHVVVRSGSQGLGELQVERRNLHRDYAHYMGEPPSRIVRVWLIANSVFQRQRGVCSFSDIRLRCGDRETVVL
jgi:hypothetical protein